MYSVTRTILAPSCSRRDQIKFGVVDRGRPLRATAPGAAPSTCSEPAQGQTADRSEHGSH